VLRRLKAEFESTARGKGLQMFMTPSPVWVLSDPVLLHGVLANLISNAIKYTSVGPVRVELEVLEGQVCVSVRDSGIGIREDKLDLIFKEFVRLDASESGSEGLGLGLSIVKRYSLLLGHRLSVESELGRGSRFSVYLPLSAAGRPEVRADDQPALGPSQLEGLRVLVVDNVELLLSSMIQTLSGWGCVVCAAHDLAEALLVTRDQTIHVVISDFHLGDLEPDGLQLIAAIRSRSPEFLPAMLMTGDVSAQLEIRAQDESVKVLHKPVRPTILRSGLLELLEQAGRDSRVTQV
jgi:CheY-like chemotaxis protein